MTIIRYYKYNCWGLIFFVRGEKGGKKGGKRRGRGRRGERKEEEERRGREERKGVRHRERGSSAGAPTPPLARLLACLPARSLARLPARVHCLNLGLVYIIVLMRRIDIDEEDEEIKQCVKCWRAEEEDKSRSQHISICVHH